MKKKVFPALFLIFSSLCFSERHSSFAAQTALQGLFFDAAKISAAEIYGNAQSKERLPPLLRNLVKANEKNAGRFYSRKIAFFDEKHNLVPMYLSEFLVRDRLGEIDCFYGENDYAALSSSGLFENAASGDYSGNASGDVSGNASGNDIDEKSFGWIDRLLALSRAPSKQEKQNENFGGNAILKMLENGGGNGTEDSEKDFQNESGNYDDEAEKPSFSYERSDGTLRRFFYDGEGMSVNVLDGITYIARNYGNETVRKRFDSKYRLFLEEKFSFDSALKNTELAAVKKYSYMEDSSVPVSMTETQFDKKIEIESEFNEAGLVSKVKTIHWTEEPEEKNENPKNENPKNENPKNENPKSAGINQKNESEAESAGTKKKFFDDKLEIYFYDGQNRVLEYELTTWNYRTNMLGRLFAESLKTKYEYSYHAENEDGSIIPPDYKYYENGELRMERIYSALDDYSEKLVFPSGLYVETFYKDGVKKREIIYANGKESRRREFD